MDQDLRTAKIAIMHAIYEYGPIPCNLSQVLVLIACTEDELKHNHMFGGYTMTGAWLMQRENHFSTSARQLDTKERV